MTNSKTRELHMHRYGHVNGVTDHNQRQSGFTLIELMVVLVIIGLIAAFAYPSYQDSVRKSRRSLVKSALLDIATRQEQYFNDNKTYTTSLPTLKAAVYLTTDYGKYYNAPTIAATGSIATGYTITATARDVQLGDKSCRTFTYTSTGKKTSANDLGAASKCW